MNFNDFQSIKMAGFRGFITVQELWDDFSDIPKERGVYLVINPNHNNTKFIQPGSGGFFKSKDPNLAIVDLQENYIPGAQVVYIGKAGSLTGKATLHSRIIQYLRFGQGKNVGHYGGRLIWQIKNHQELLFCWKRTPQEDPREVEKILLQEFYQQYGSFPFANLMR